MSKRDADIERIRTYAMMTQALGTLVVMLFIFTAFVEMKEQMQWVMLSIMIVLMIPALVFGKKWFKAMEQLD